MSQKTWHEFCGFVQFGADPDNNLDLVEENAESALHTKLNLWLRLHSTVQAEPAAFKNANVSMSI